MHAVQSIVKTAQEPERVDVVAKIDDDDSETLQYLLKNKPPHLSLVTSPRGRGYQDLGRFTTEGCMIAQSPWCFNFDDDAYLEQLAGFTPWDEQLALIPLDSKFFARPQFMELNGRFYSTSDAEYCVFFENGFWKKFGLPGIEGMPDSFALHTMIPAGWKLHILEGLVMHHARGSDAEMAHYHRDATL